MSDAWSYLLVVTPLPEYIADRTFQPRRRHREISVKGKTLRLIDTLDIGYFAIGRWTKKD